MRDSLGAALVAALLIQPQVATAQDQQAPQSLEDLIPDSAVENPEDWAGDGVSGAAQDAEDVGPVLEPDTPLAELPELTVPWPEDVDLPQLAPLEPQDDIEFAAIEDENTPQPVLVGAELMQVSNDLVLAFPDDSDRFPEQTEFLSRFEALSTIEELSGDDDDNLALLRARAREDEALLRRLLRVYGYYDSQVIRTVGGSVPEDSPAASGPGVRFDILPGAQYRFGAIDLGNLAAAPDFDDLRATFEIQSGDPLLSDMIVAERYDLDTKLGETGYPFAKIDEPGLLIDHQRSEGDLTMPVEPGGKFVFGEVISQDPKFLSGEHLTTIARFETGDIYQRSLEFDLRRAITATGLVSAVTLTPREVSPPTGGEPGVVNLEAEMTRAPLRTIAGAIGYGSEEGIRLEASWEHRNFFPPEGSLKIRGIAGTQEQLAGLTFRRNNFGGRDRILNADLYASTVDSDAFDARTVAAIVSYERVSTLLFQKPLSWSIGAEAIASGERPPAINGVKQPRDTYLVFALPGSALIDTSDSLLDPTEGFRLGGRLSPEVSRNEGTQSFYVRSQVDASYYKSVGGSSVLAGRVRLATIPGTDLENIAPSRRLYAGGGGSVRGYGYQAIGPTNTDGEPIGGRSLIELSAEARIRTGLLDGAVSIVPFLDAGSVSRGTTPDFDSIKIGAGVGVRYHTAFGPIRVDVGVPLNPGPDDSPVAVYVALGQAF
ncbi:BamA/TamA family outer membrane protein [Altererythrobacter sp. ZODW24]|uniref:autotransporter assembly complex protein TamA n=1 Tax=Altererythrobacter sp. ZODW24 TaxID=2185142 RepID=UPI001F079599|nr:BamA/TamA family outer membrane protein [Altererythrobacter sp. ZODW24]